MRIPVCNADGEIIERVDLHSLHARRLLVARNASVVRKRHRGEDILGQSRMIETRLTKII
jgi:hypothetical protein